MPFRGLSQFIDKLEKEGQLKRIKSFFSPELEITEVTDRITKSGGPALLFENNGTSFPVLINAYGSDSRMSAALGRDSLEEAGKELESLFRKITGSPGLSGSGLSGLASLFRLGMILPSKSRKKGLCQHTVITNPDLSMLPVLKCWPYDGGRFITLPVVHTFHPVTGKTNAGMYRMQVIDGKTTGMHWQLHKTGAAHFEAWKKEGTRMPVSVTLGGDPVYAYAATAPLPENIDEYILAGFLRKKRVRLVKCITNDIYVPEDADIVIEGYVDPGEELFLEGPFGDHTGFYSLADLYPRFRVTCITHARNAVYPATIVGVPPQEDEYLARATEKIFLSPIRMTLQPEIEDLHMPPAGVAHNLAVVRIRKTYPGQGMKVINSLLGAGQMMFTKYLVVVSGELDISEYTSLLSEVLANTDFSRDVLFCRGPLDVLDHSSDTFAFGGKMGVDATFKLESELADKQLNAESFTGAYASLAGMVAEKLITAFGEPFNAVLVISAATSADEGVVRKIADRFKADPSLHCFRLVFITDSTVDISDPFMVAWQLLGNSDPVRDHCYFATDSLLIDGTIKLFRPEGFPRRWPNIVCSDPETISVTDQKWFSAGLGELIPSPSLRLLRMKRPGEDEIII